MQNDGSQSWIVISRGANKYVTELPEANEKLIHYEEVASGSGKHRKNGALVWRRLLHMFCRDHHHAPKWMNQMWIDYLQKGREKKRFQYCLGSNGFILQMRATQGHSGWNQVDPSLQDKVEIPCNWIEYIYYVGSSHDRNSIEPTWSDRRRKRYERRKASGTLHSRGPNERTPKGRAPRHDTATSVLYRTKRKVYQNEE